MEKLSIRTDLGVGDQKVNGKMNSNGVWVINEISICGLSTGEALKELRLAMIEGNKIMDEVNSGRGLKKPVKKTEDKPAEEKTEDKPEDKSTKKTKSKNKKLETAAPPTEDKPDENKDPDISGGTPVTPDSGEKGKKPSG